jgi:excisionase family DNA binding protein
MADINIRNIPDELKDEFQMACLKNHTKMSPLIVRWIETYVERKKDIRVESNKEVMVDKPKETTIENGYIHINEAAQRLGKSPRTVRRMAQNGSLYAQKVDKISGGSEWMINEDDVARLEGEKN